MAREFTRLTYEGNRKNMSHEAYKIWARRILKKILRPECFIIAATNISNMEVNSENRSIFGKAIDNILKLKSKSEGKGGSMSMAVDKILKENLGDILRNDIYTYVIFILEYVSLYNYNPI